MALLDEMQSLGANVKEGMERVMDDQSLYEMMLGMFVDEVEKDVLSPEDFDKEDLEEVIKRVHTLKGVAGNLSITPLFDGYMEALTLLRAGDAAKAKEVFTAMLPTQEKVLECIKRYR